ncbi:MAG: hypothetical protein GY833_10260, partial [Aestuariibacter sp.]|nr:hypothetical protein [Aestuariibacter sp.]
MLFNPWGGGVALPNASSWSTAVPTTTAAWTTVQQVTINVPMDLNRSAEPIIQLDVSVTWRQKSSSTAKYVRGRVVACNSGGTYQVIMADADGGNAYIEDAADASSYTNHTVALSGITLVTDLLDTVPIDVAVQIIREDATENATGQVLSAGYVRVIWGNN